MATDLSTASPGQTQYVTEITLSATPDTLMKVILPKEIKDYVLTLRAKTTAGYYVVVGTDGQLVGSAPQVPLDANTFIEADQLRWSGKDPTNLDNLPAIYLGSTTASQVVKLILGWRP